jgi:putative FmdB family regulatory protein
MPLYEYECEACAHRFEVIQKFSDAPISVCPKCGGAVHKLLSSPAIQFKGSGFYLTDYGRGTGSKSEGSANTKAGKNDSGASSSDSGKSDSTSPSSPSTESKPVAKAD